LEDGEAFLIQQAEAIKTRSSEMPSLNPVGNPWEFMRLAAGQGLAGIISISQEGVDAQFEFAVRADEASQELPTVLRIYQCDGGCPCLTRSGERDYEPFRLLPWKRFDILDPITARFGIKQPFGEIEEGKHFYEIRSKAEVLVIMDFPLLGDWISFEGAVPFFSSEEAAHDFLHHRLGSHGAGFYRFPSESTISEENDEEIQVTPVTDLAARIEELSRLLPLANWCVNPVGHREKMAYGRFRAMDPCEVNEAAHFTEMHMVSGLWKIKPNNNFEKVQVKSSWGGDDTILWSGGGEPQLLPLDRSFCNRTGLPPVEDYTYEELEELANDLLQSGPDDLDLKFNEDPLFTYRLSCWDAITGDHIEGISFPSFLGAIAFVGVLNREADEEIRRSGATLCSGHHSVATESAEFSHSRTQTFEQALKRIIMRVLQKGYTPRDSSDLVWLCNSLLRTLHVRFAGYAIDIITALPSIEPEESLLEELEIDESGWERAQRFPQEAVDAEGEALALDRLGTFVWQKMSPSAKLFTSTALLHLKWQGHAPQLDYAGISIGIVKALEVELGEILRGFSRQNQLEFSIVSEYNNRHEGELVRFLNGGQTPSLGCISYLLRDAPAADAHASRAFIDYVGSLPGGEYLKSNRFNKRILQKVMHEFRNGGAHDKPITEAVCRDCVETILGTQEKPGCLAMIVGLPA
jgi:hypothetical protein